jgi:restriction system protein
MAVPTFDEMMLPLLQYSSDGNEHHLSDALSALGQYFHWSQSDMEELMPDGQRTRAYYNLQWAKTYLTKSQLLESTGRGRFKITQRGLGVLATSPQSINKKYLLQFPEFTAFATSTGNTGAIEAIDNPQNIVDNIQTPDEIMQTTYQQLQATLTDDLLETVLAQSPVFFEKLVVNLLLAMGYGSSLDSGRQTRLSGDEGIDGYIEEDKLGLDVIYIQAKRWDRGNVVGRPAVQGFVGSLVGAGAKKGVFITTSDFSSGAVDYARAVKDLKIILINGEQLAKLMIEHGVGVSVKTTYIIKQIDENYFPEV